MASLGIGVDSNGQQHLLPNPYALRSLCGEQVAEYVDLLDLTDDRESICDECWGAYQPTPPNGTDPTMTTDPIGHPAKFSEPILDRIATLIDKYRIEGLAVDPFAGVGRIHELATPTLATMGVEIEAEWADQHPDTICGDSRGLVGLVGMADAIITSPAYGNRMCLTAGTMILTWEGPTPIEDIQPGTLVLTHDGRWCPVTWAGSRGTKPVVTVIGQGGGAITCTPDHPFWSACKGDNGICDVGWRDANNLSPRTDLSPRSAYRFHYWSHPVDTTLPRLPSCPRGSDVWWFIGFYLGNGSVGRNSTSGSPSTITVTKDLSLVATVEDRLTAVGAARLPDVGNMGRWALYDSDLACWLRATFGHSAYTKTVPGWVLGLDPDERAALLDGWLDADGCRRGDRPTRVGVSVSERLTRGMQSVAASVGRSTGWSVRGGYEGEIMGHPSTFVDAFRLDVHNGVSRRAHLADGSIWYAVRNVVPAGNAEVFDLEVADAHSFIANGIAVHNSDRYAGDAKGSKRHTYRIALGRPLDEHNGAGMQWGAGYRELHAAVWGQCRDVLCNGKHADGGWMIVNVSDHIRGGRRMPVVRWHIRELSGLGFRLVEASTVGTARQRHGRNGGLRVDGEQVLVFRHQLFLS